MSAEHPPIDGVLGWRTVAGLSVLLAFGVTAVLGSTLSLFLAPIEQETGWSRTTIALGLSATAFIAPVVAPVTGWLIDRVSLRPFVLIGVVLQALNIAAFGLVGGNPWTFYVTMGALIFTGAGASYVVASKILQGWFDCYRGRAMGIMFAVQGIGMAVLPPIAQALIEHVGWRGAFFSLGLIMVVPCLVAATCLVFERVPAQVRADDRERLRNSEAIQLPGLFHMLRMPRWWILSLWNLLFAFAVGGLFFQLAPLVQSRGVTPTQVAYALSAMAGGRMAGDLLAGVFVDRYQARLVACFTMLVPLAALAMLAFGNGAFFVFSAMIVLGITSGADGCLSSYLPQRYFHPEVYGQAFMSQAVIGAIGGGFAPYVSALLFEGTGGYEWPIVVAAVAFAGAALSALALPQPDDRSQVPTGQAVPSLSPEVAA